MWVNTKYDIRFVHDNYADKEAFIKRYQNRINNFRVALNGSKKCVMILFVDYEIEVSKINELYDVFLQRIGSDCFSFVLLNYGNDIQGYNKKIYYNYAKFPNNEYNYMNLSYLYSKNDYELLSQIVEITKKAI